MIRTNTGYDIFFAPGKFDKWGVYIDNHEYNYAMLLDSDYFQWLLDLANKYGVDKVYSDFLIIYNDVSEDFNEEKCLNLCQNIDKNYQEDTTHWWVILYMTMVAECKKDFTILKKRIKLLGVYNILFDGYDINYVIKYMKDKDWRYLDKLMKERGI